MEPRTLRQPLTSCVPWPHDILSRERRALTPESRGACATALVVKAYAKNSDAVT
jgi:hypothetical protein